jgi:hypothetical protein
VEGLKNLVPTLTVDIIHKKLLPSAIALSAAKAKKRLTETPETGCVLNLKEFKALVIDTLMQGQEFEKDVREMMAGSSNEEKISTFYDLLSSKFGRKATCNGLLSAIDSAQGAISRYRPG